MRKLFISGLSAIALTILGIQPADSQVTVSLGGVSAAAPEKGTTNNLNLSSGSRTSLVVGNSTSFGASVNLNASVGVTAVSNASLIPTSVGIESSIGMNDAQKTNINISNLSSKDLDKDYSQSTDSTGTSGSTVESGSSSASGIAVIDGMSAAVNLNIKTPGTVYTEGGETSTHAGPGKAEYNVAVFPNRAGTMEDQSEACLESITYCNYESSDNLTSGNAASSANLSTSTNIDINASDFTNIFAQSF